MSNSIRRGWLTEARFAATCVAGAWLLACSDGTDPPPRPGPTGGAAGRGGGTPVAPPGGLVDPGDGTPRGGATGAGGAAASFGGETAVGGSPSSGGSLGVGGSLASGGAFDVGGSTGVSGFFGLGGSTFSSGGDLP